MSRWPRSRPPTRIARPETSRRRSRRSRRRSRRVTGTRRCSGATGTGKTATMAWIIEKVGRPALVIAHNKTLAAQLCNEFREFLPDNAVEYFVSYYDYYQPEAYVPQADLYIEKDSSRNDDISRLRLAATSALFTRRDVVVVASVSCIYGLGSPEEWRGRVLILNVGETIDRDDALRMLIESQYVRNDTVLARGRFRVKGDVVEVQPANSETAYRVSFFGDEVESISHFDPLTGEVYARLDNLVIWPATEYVTSTPTIERAVDDIRHELEEQVRLFESQGKMLEAHRLRQRTEYDLEMMRELGFCSGIENYSRHLEGRPPRLAPVHAARLLPRRLRRVRGRVAPDRPAARRHVRGRPLAQADARRLRLPAALGARQPAAPLRRVPRQGEAARLRLGDAGAVRAAPLAGGRRAADPADVRRRPRGRGARDQEPDRRPAQRDPPPRGGGRARAGDDADEEDGRGPDRLPARGGRRRPATCTRRSTRSSGSRSSGSCGSASTTCWSGSTCCARGSTCPRCRSSRSSTRTRRASCAGRPRSSRRSGAPPGTSTGRCCSTGTR